MTNPKTVAVAVALLAALAIAGCSGGERAPAVNPSLAREALHTALDGWKDGKTPDALKAASPSIVVQDFDWMAGFRLVGYEVTGDGKDDDANLRIPVTLTMRSPQGKEVRKNVSYVVGTAPTLTVFRDFQ